MFCTNCGAQMADGTLFCTDCGTRLKTEQPAPAPAAEPTPAFKGKSWMALLIGAVAALLVATIGIALASFGVFG